MNFEVRLQDLDASLRFQSLSYPEHAQEVLEFFVRNGEFLRTVENIEPNASAVEQVFCSLPKGTKPDQKLVIGIYQDSQMVAFLELIKDRQRPGEWLLSLLIVDVNHRRTGLGRGVVSALEARLWKLGVDSVLLGVVESNVIAASFWQSLGYIRTDILSKQNFDDQEVTIRAFYKECP